MRHRINLRLFTGPGAALAFRLGLTALSLVSIVMGLPSMGQDPLLSPMRKDLMSIGFGFRWKLYTGSRHQKFCRLFAKADVDGEKTDLWPFIAPFPEKITYANFANAHFVSTASWAGGETRRRILLDLARYADKAFRETYPKRTIEAVEVWSSCYYIHPPLMDEAGFVKPRLEDWSPIRINHLNMTLATGEMPPFKYEKPLDE